MSEDRSYATYRLTDENRDKPVETAVLGLYRVLLNQKAIDAFLAFTEKKPGGGMQVVSAEASTDVSNLDHRLLSQYIVTRLPRLLSIPKIIQSQLGGCFDKKIAFVAHPCEIEALIELSKRNQIAFDNLFIIGLECPGSVSFSDLASAVKKQGADPLKIDHCEITPTEVAVAVPAGKNIILKLGQAIKLRECCTRCGNREPAICDINLSAWRRDMSTGPTIFVRSGTEKGKACIALAKKQGLLAAGRDSELSERSQMDSVVRSIEKNAAEKLSKQNEELVRLEGQSRFKNLKGMLDPCTKCGLCVRACPVCWCKDCILLKKIKTLDPLLLHATRLVHMGDACVNCGKCDENCPKGIQLSMMYYGLANELSRLPGHKTGLSLGQSPQASGRVILGKA